VDAGSFMRIAIGVFFVLFGLGLIYMLIRLAGVFSAAGAMVQDVDREVVPILNRLQTTVDEVNQELGSVGSITGNVAAATGALENTTRAVQHTVGSPLKTVAGVSAGLSRAVTTLFEGKRKEA